MVEPLNTKTLTAADLVEIIAHKEQIGIWANEIATAISLGDMLKEDWSFDDSVDLEREIVAQLRDVLSSAFSHPAYNVATLITTQQQEIDKLTKERDQASAEAYKANKAADALNGAMKDAGDRAAAIWRQFRDLRIEITGDGPMCRDCADFDGRCQGNGPPCDPDEAVKEKLATWRAAESRVQSLEEEVKVLREALKPFADVSEEIVVWADASTSIWKSSVMSRGVIVDDFRHARAALKEKGNG